MSVIIVIIFFENAVDLLWKDTKMCHGCFVPYMYSKTENDNDYVATYASLSLHVYGPQNPLHRFSPVNCLISSSVTGVMWWPSLSGPCRWFSKSSWRKPFISSSPSMVLLLSVSWNLTNIRKGTYNRCINRKPSNTSTYMYNVLVIIINRISGLLNPLYLVFPHYHGTYKHNYGYRYGSWFMLSYGS